MIEKNCMEDTEKKQLEIDLLVEAIFRCYGYDFRQYARASLKRRLDNHIAKNQIDSIADLIPLVIKDKSAFQALLFDISVTVTEMFRDPWFFAKLREQVFPFLRTFPFFNIWQAGCATGEEVYSLAILLMEEGLYSRCRIYATDFNDQALEIAKSRIYPLNRMRNYSLNYQQAGGKKSFSDYYLAKYDAAIFDPALQEKVTFASHNLATDGVFGEIHLILCRNVLIYFDRPLQNRVLRIFTSSLRRNGFLCLGSRESLNFSEVSDLYTLLARNERIYRLNIQTGQLPTLEGQQ